MSEHDPSTPAFQDTVVDQKAAGEDDGDTDADVRSLRNSDTLITPEDDGPEVIYQEGRPPLRHTEQVRIRQEQASRHHEHDRTNTRSSTELAERSRGERRKERDRNAERAAMRTLLLVAAVGGIGTFIVVNTLVDDEPSPKAAIEDPNAGRTPGEDGDPNAQPPVDPSKGKQPGFIGTKAKETVDLPAIRSMSSEGLTIGCEGLPQVIALAGEGPAALAAIETCRFAYGIWEFSPNNAFRFISTCKAMGGLTLVGAYEIDHEAGVVRMSPLVSGGAQLVSTFEVERPSKMTTVITVGDVQLQVNQKVTIMRPGMDAESFRKGLSAKNEIDLRVAPSAPAPIDPGGAPPPAPGGPAPAGGAKDPVLELLKGS